MKKTVAILGGVAALGSLLYVATLAYAQQPAGAPASKIAVVNINKVVKEFKYANAWGEWLIARSKQYAEAVKSKEAAIEVKKKEAEKEPDAVKREAIANQMKAIAREIEDLNQQGQKEIGTKQGEIAVDVYKKIEAVVAGIAKSYGLELVLYYPDATDAAEMNLPATIFRKLSAPAAMPVYVAPHLDITNSVVETLNRQHATPASPAPAGGGAAAAPPATAGPR